MVRWNIMIHYFITWFEYNDHYENLHKVGTRGRDGTQISKTKCAVRIIVLQPRDDILGRVGILIITKCEKI
jgi:hypothetical protein